MVITKIITRVLVFFFILIYSCNTVDYNKVPLPPVINNSNEYQFVIAGHAYGAHQENNQGLYPPLHNYLLKSKNKFDFIIFSGDMTRSGTEMSWNTILKELNLINIPYYFVMGNNDNSEIGREYFDQQYGKTYYSFNIGKEQFIILDSQEESRAISKRQISFLEEELNSLSRKINNVFILFHEVLWNKNEKYKDIKSNGRSRFNQIQMSNYWEELHPMLLKYKNINFFVVSGDVGGNKSAIPAYYEKIHNVTLIASGMGEIKESNLLLTKISNSKVSFKLLPLHEGVKLNNIEFYSIDNLIDYYNPREDI